LLISSNIFILKTALKLFQHSVKVDNFIVHLWGNGKSENEGDLRGRKGSREMGIVWGSCKTPVS